jgi:hypothetical protein
VWEARSSSIAERESNTMTESLPTTAVVRVGRVTFDSSLYDAVVAADKKTSDT